MKSNAVLTAAITERLVRNLTETEKSRAYFTITTTRISLFHSESEREELAEILGQDLFQRAYESLQERHGNHPHTITLIVPETSKGLALNLLKQDQYQLYKLGFVLRTVLEDGEFLTVRADERRQFTAHLVGTGPDCVIVLNG